MQKINLSNNFISVSRRYLWVAFFCLSIICGGLFALVYFWVLLLFLPLCGAILVASLVFLPRFKSHFNLCIADEGIILQNGVITQKTALLHPEHIQYIERFAGPFERSFNVVNIKIAMAGFNVFLPCLSHENAAALFEEVKKFE
ncbi:MAG: PH domain-containing protein [Oscillospiraceae bacterium]|jgi:membrane protein YdbS with pleckstrin-like domain|nr:PH domain-containing protein [Oscillospiraceae bacterium]